MDREDDRETDPMDTEDPLIARRRLEAVEAEFLQAKLDGTVTTELRTKLSDTRRWYRERWRPLALNGVQPSVVETGITSIGQGY